MLLQWIQMNTRKDVLTVTSKFHSHKHRHSFYLTWKSLHNQRLCKRTKGFLHEQLTWSHCHFNGSKLSEKNVGPTNSNKQIKEHIKNNVATFLLSSSTNAWHLPSPPSSSQSRVLWMDIASFRRSVGIGLLSVANTNNMKITMWHVCSTWNIESIVPGTHYIQAASDGKTRR